MLIRSEQPLISYKDELTSGSVPKAIESHPDTKRGVEKDEVYPPTP
jgi:hypothetical protein